MHKEAHFSLSGWCTARITVMQSDDHRVFVDKDGHEHAIGLTETCFLVIGEDRETELYRRLSSR